MKTEKTVTVATKEVAEAFKNLGIDAVVKGAAPTETSTEDVELLKGQIDTLNTTIGEKDAEIAELKKAAPVTGDNVLTKAMLDEKVASLGLIEKAVYDKVESLTESVDAFIKSATEKIDTIEDEVLKIGTTGMPRKTAKDTRVIEKAFEVDKESGKKVLSKSKHARAIVELLDGISESDAENKDMYADATMRFETSRQLTKAIEADLLENHEIQIIE